jgi:hypothetical protein
VGGSVTSTKTATGATPQSSTITPTSLISGNVVLSGDVTTWAPRCTSGATGWDPAGNACAAKKASVVGALSYNVNGLAAPAAPAVPDWVDYKYLESDWTALGFTVVKWTNSSFCKIDNQTSQQAFALALSTYTTPTVIDATGCSQLLFSLSANNNNGLNLNLKTDIAFVSRSIGIERLRANSNNTTQRKLWFLVSDPTANGQPTCSGGAGDISLGNDIIIGDTVAAIAYTPCNIADNSTKWRGQLYASAVTFGANISLAYLPVGLPNADLTNGTSTAGASGSSGSGLGSRVSVRNI